MNLQLAWSVLADAFSKWNEHKAIRLGAALAYFGIFAIAPVLIIAIASLDKTVDGAKPNLDSGRGALCRYSADEILLTI